MPFGDRSLQALDASGACATEEYCPECGQPLTLRVSPTGTGSAHPWWSYVLVLVGAYLIVRYGPPAWSWYRELARGVELMRAFGVDPRDPAVARGWGPDMAFTTYAVAQVELRSKLTGLAVGLLAVLLAVQGWLRRGPRSATAASGRLVDLCASGERLLLATFGLIFLGYLYLLVTQLVSGVPLTFDVADATAARVIDVVGSLVQTIATGSSVAGYDGTAVS